LGFNRCQFIFPGCGFNWDLIGVSSFFLAADSIGD
jgi:hypothetical protein